jgi:NAD(P)H dehydrogenase (quinone)
MKVLIVYYSTYGHVYRMATLVAEGVKEVSDVQPVVRTVPELIPKSVIDARADMKAAKEMQQDVPLVTMDDFREPGRLLSVLQLGSETSRHNSRIKSTS